MFKTLSAAALSATVALAALSPTPAHAIDQDAMARWALGIGALAILGTAVKEYNDRKDDERKDELKKALAKASAQQPVPPRVEVQRPVTTRPNPVEVSRVVPASCARTFRTTDGERTYLTRVCLEQAGVRTASLPVHCERVLDMPGNREDRRVWGQVCLQNQGYRIR